MVARKDYPDLFQYLPISQFSSDLFRFAFCSREYPDLFRFAAMSCDPDFFFKNYLPPRAHNVTDATKGGTSAERNCPEQK